MKNLPPVSLTPSLPCPADLSTIALAKVEASAKEEARCRFLALRSQGKTYDQIAADLGVSRRTLFYWNQQLQEELAFEETAELETLRQELLGTREARARRLAKRLAAIEDELDKRSLADLSTARLFTLADSFRRQLTKETTPQTHGRANLRVSPEQTTPSTNNTQPSTSSVQCNDSAIAVQPESGRANLPVSPEQVPALRPAPIQESTNPSIQSSSQCNDSAITVQSQCNPSPVGRTFR